MPRRQTRGEPLSLQQLKPLAEGQLDDLDRVISIVVSNGHNLLLVRKDPGGRVAPDLGRGDEHGRLRGQDGPEATPERRVVLEARAGDNDVFDEARVHLSMCVRRGAKKEEGQGQGDGRRHSSLIKRKKQPGTSRNGSSRITNNKKPPRPGGKKRVEK